MHPFARGKMSDYKMRLMEKQKLRYYYWVAEKQFRRYVIGFAPSILAARQLVVHGHITVDSGRVDRPSYSVRTGEVISVKESSKKMPPVQDALVRSQARPELAYVKVDKSKLLGSLIEIPKREEIPLPLDEGLVVEYYAKYI
jgi:small subunit ribosomal protein S4